MSVIGVLALQGAFARHAEVLADLGVDTIEVRRPAQLDDVDALVLPGGESGAMSMLLDRAELYDPLAERLGAGMPAFGTCAGMILLAASILDGRADQRSFGVIDIDVRRNGYGRQVNSFDVALDVDGFDGAFDASFIRAPIVERAGDRVDVLASVDGRPVLCRQGPVLVAAFHPELSSDTRIHRRFLQEVI